MQTPRQQEGQRATFASRLRSRFFWPRTSESRGRSKQGAFAPSPFIVGAGRSGTTLLRLMLDAHPDLTIPPETHFIHRTAKACEQASDPKQAFLETVMSHHRWEDFRIEGNSLTQRVTVIEPFNLSEALRTFYELYAKKFGKSRWGDKTPPYVHRMTLIQGLLPEARFIHLIRDGRDVALSTKNLWFGANSVEEAAQRWRALIEKARRQAKELPYYLEIRYEDLVLEPEYTLRIISDFIDLPWNPSMLAYHETAGERMREIHRDVVVPKDERLVRAEERSAIHRLTSRPPQRDRIGRWKREMTASDRKRFEEFAGETLRELGYSIG